MEQSLDKKITPATDGVVIDHSSKKEGEKSVYIESYGCQMNFSDSEVVASILAKEGYQTTPKMDTADLILVNTCSIREKAELTVRKRLEKFNAVKKNESQHEGGRFRLYGRTTQAQVS